MSALLALRAQNANIISKLWTIATQVSLFYPLQLRRKEVGFQGAQILLSLGLFFQVIKSSYIHSLYVDGIDANSPQDTEDCSLKYKPYFLYYCYLYDFGGKCERADFYYSFSFFFKFVLEDSFRDQ